MQVPVCTVQFVFALNILLNKEIKGPFKGQVILTARGVSGITSRLEVTSPEPTS